MSKLIAMVGLPRSGKSTFCNHTFKPQGFVIVNPDNFRLAIHGTTFNPPAEPFVWAAVYAAVDALLLTGHDVVVDATNITQKRREPWVLRKAEFHLMGTRKAVCLERAKSDGREELIPIIEKMAKDCDWPEAIGL